MDNKKYIVNLESFRDMLHICLRLRGQSFVEPPFEEEVLSFLHFLRHSGAIRKLTDVNINKLHQPWRSFAAIINKCLTGKSSGYDSLRFSQAQILWGLYHKRNVHFAYLMWEDFVYQVEHKDTNKSNEMYYPRFTKVIIHYFMSKDPSIPKRNKKTKSSFDTTITPSTVVAGPKLTTSEKGKQAAKASKANSLSVESEVAMTEAQKQKLATKRSLQQKHISQASGSGVNKGTGTLPGVLDVPTDESEEEISWNSTDKEGDDDEAQDDDDEGNDEDDEEEEIRDEESFDPIPKTPEDTDDEGNNEENIGINVSREEGHDEGEEEDELYRDVNINQGRGH
nr:hypothetical protein [Tanacetum cinerariifolium]